MIIEMGIGWMPDPEKPGGLVSANPGDYAREIERLRKIETAARDLMDNSPIGDDDKPYCSDVAGREFDALYLSLNPTDK